MFLSTVCILYNCIKYTIPYYTIYLYFTHIIYIPIYRLYLFQECGHSAQASYTASRVIQPSCALWGLYGCRHWLVVCIVFIVIVIVTV